MNRAWRCGVMAALALATSSPAARGASPAASPGSRTPSPRVRPEPERRSPPEPPLPRSLPEVVRARALGPMVPLYPDSARGA